MKLIIAGGREIRINKQFIHKYLGRYNLKPQEIVSGEARGVDRVAKWYANSHGIKYVPFPVTKEEWGKYGKPAGPMRNKRMAEYGTHLLLIWDGQSNGSANMKREMQQLGKPVFEVILKKRGADEESE